MQDTGLGSAVQDPRYTVDATSTPTCTTSDHEQGTFCQACLRLEDRSTQHDALVNMLPRELISRIFQFCLVRRDENEITKEAFHWYHDAQTTSTPFELMLVSQAWRSITISTPQLWTHLSFRTSKLEGFDGYFIFTRDCLLRSGSLPLSFVVFCEEDTVDGHIFEPYIDLFNAHSQRWYSAFWFVPPSVVQQLTGNGDNSMMYSLHIDTSDSYHEGYLKFPGDMPQLRKVTLRGAFRYSTENWERITHLTMGLCSTPEKILNVLRTARCLESFTVIDILSKSVDIPADFPVITLPKLRELTLGTIKSSLEDLLKALRLPALSSVSIFKCDYTSPIAVWLRQWGCSVRDLSIADSYDEAEDVLALLEACPALETLKIDSSQVDMGEILEHIAQAQDTGTPFLPRLRMLQFSEKNVSIPWSIFPRIFIPGFQEKGGSIFGDDNASNDPVIRAVEDDLCQRKELHLKISVGEWSYAGSRSRRNFFIPKEHIPALLELKRQGFHLDVEHQHHRGQDFVAMSAEFYGN